MHRGRLTQEPNNPAAPRKHGQPGRCDASNAVKTCFPNVPKRLASRCVDGASECDENIGAVDGDDGENATILYSELQPAATPCESVLQFAGSQGAVAQWLELGTHNP